MKIKSLDTSTYELYTKAFPMSDLCARILASKKLSIAAVDDLLNTKMKTNDFDLSFLDPVIARLQQAKTQQEKIIVCGDYDCDGMCATTILVDAIRRFGIECGYYIPNRFSEGYGLQVKTVQLAIEKGYHLIITVDNGVKALDALQLARDNGIEIILTDHHQYVEEELIYDYFLHPAIFPQAFQNLCGAGVAYLVSKRLIGNDFKHTMLACVATIGDVVSLTDANRVIVKEGIDLFNSKSYIALQLLQNDTKRWDAKKIAFQIVPKLNSIGRLADEANANNIVQYLLLENPDLIHKSLYQINDINTKRKAIGATMENKAKQLIDDEDFLVVYDESFHEGLNGIVASKLVSLTQKPAMVLSQNDNVLKGSIRSNGIDLTHFFDEVKESLIAYGGHKEAAGISFDLHHLPIIKEHIRHKMKTIHYESEIACILVNREELSYESIESLRMLEPFGCGFNLPFFCIQEKNFTIQPMSNGIHLKYIGDGINYLYFNMGHRLQADKEKAVLTFIGQLEANNYWGKKSISMIVDTIIEDELSKGEEK